MKKILAIMLVFMLIFAGCDKKNTEKLDLEKIEIEINNITYRNGNKDVKLFNANKSMSSELLMEKYGVDTSYFEEFLVSVPTLVDSASMFAIFLPIDGEESKAQAEIDKFFNKYEAAWSLGYAPLEEKLIEDRLEKKYGDYLIYVVSNDNDAVFNKIKSVK